MRIRNARAQRAEEDARLWRTRAQQAKSAAIAIAWDRDLYEGQWNKTGVDLSRALITIERVKTTVAALRGHVDEDTMAALDEALHGRRSIVDVPDAGDVAFGADPLFSHSLPRDMDWRVPIAEKVVDDLIGRQLLTGIGVNVDPLFIGWGYLIDEELLAA